METATNAIINALVISSMYILISLGFALLLSIAGILNFSHGAIYMVSGYICYQLAIGFGINQWVSLLLSVIIVGCFGLFLERFCFRPFFRDVNRTIIMTIVIIIFLETTINVLVGSYTMKLPSFVPGLLQAGVISVSAERLATFLIGGALLFILTWIINKSKIGQQMLAVAQDHEGAALQGININRISALACVMGCALAAVAGCLMGALFQLSPFSGDRMLIKAIEIVILSGIGSIGGILIGGLIIGSMDALLPLFTSGAVTQAVSILIIILILLIRPQGFFGHEV